MTNEHTSLEKYTLTLYSKGLRKGCVWEVSWRLNSLQHIDPQVPPTIAALLSHSAGLLNRGSWGTKPSAGSWFSLPRTPTRTPTNWLQLTQAICGTGLYNCLLLLVGVAFAPNSTRQGDTQISSTGCTCFLIEGWVEGQYVTLGVIAIDVGNGYDDTNSNSWTKLRIFHIALILLEKVWIPLLSRQLRVKGRIL